MMRGIPDSLLRYFVGGCLALALAGCARIMFTEREPWRREAEVACLQSGAVKEGPAVTIIKSIDGPGMCGADYPLRVAALGDPGVLGFADDQRPPGPAPLYAQAAPNPAAGTY